MVIVTNDSLVRRNTLIGQFASMAGLLVLLGGVYVAFAMPDQFNLMWGAMIGGFILSQVGIYLSNRFGRRPRPDEHLNNGLKGLKDDYSLYHYKGPTSHLLVGPAGVWVLMPHYQRGRISFDKGRFRQRGGGFFLNYMKIFGQEGLGRPELEAEAEIDSVKRFLQKRLPEGSQIPEVEAALVFTDPRVELVNMDEAPRPSVPLPKLKELIRKHAKANPVSLEKMREIKAIFE